MVVTVIILIPEYLLLLGLDIMSLRSLRVEGDAHISTELMVNGAPQSSIYFDATHYVGGNTSGTVVVQVNQGDEVFVRTTKDNFNGGDILSDYMGRTYFGGWLLHVA